MTRAIIALCLLVAAASSQAQTICDMKAARDWCDEAMLDRVEGIWEYPDDHTCVLIRRSASDAGRYDIVVVESPDTRLNPGETIGYMKQSPSPDKFELGLYRTKKSNGIMAELGKCFARLDEKDDALLVKGRKIKFSLGSRWLLPSFWKLIRITVKDPLEALPKGMIRMYPPSKRRQPDYL